MIINATTVRRHPQFEMSQRFLALAQEEEQDHRTQILLVYFLVFTASRKERATISLLTSTHIYKHKYIEEFKSNNMERKKKKKKKKGNLELYHGYLASLLLGNERGVGRSASMSASPSSPADDSVLAFSKFDDVG